ncbi:membrane protease YdiL (CAAX protease family) [Leucobacter komagatae]|uniref:Membrane protease YdiL (CAAX protease family) n=1 Tax=Leucobacter komagatae TaxID=55969 RepID=A0A542Y732_9MICO|nr:type II CAAX endopeptidase family protein [Leucobacter komagatae]TQL43891.1 membrane protease YdiL (CAAX protease family) [Leucobacter komagatae]
MTQPPPIDGHTPNTGGATPQGEPSPAPAHPEAPAPGVPAPQAGYPQPGVPQYLPPQPGQPPLPPQPGVSPQWAWAQPQPQLVEVETEPLEYHRLYRGAPRYAWWKPLVVLVLAASIYFAMNIAFSLALMPLLVAFDPDYVNDALFMQVAPILDTQHPLSMVLNLGTIALMIPAVILAMLALGIRPTGRVWSVAAKIRWGLLLRTTGAAVLSVIVMNGVGILTGMVMEGASGAATDTTLAADAPEFNATAALISFVIVLVLVPFQAAAEEVVFRGLFLQVLGSWMRSPWLAIGLSTFAFAAMHIYDIWGLLAVGLMGLTAAWVTWKTGGLEAAIAIHVINNIAAFGFMAAGMSASTGQVESSGGPESVIGEIVGLALFAWLVVRIFRKHGYGRERIDRVWRPAAAPVRYGAL